MRYVLVIMGFLMCVPMFGQEDSSKWLFSVEGGMIYRFPNSFASEINAMLRDRSSFPQIASSTGLSITYRLNEKNSLGLDAWGVFYPETKTELSQVTLRGLAGEMKGYLQIFNKEKWELALYLGVGYYFTKSTIGNEGTLVNRPPLFIPPGSHQSIYGQLLFLDIGARIYLHNSSKLRYGLVGGLQTKLLGGDWKASWGEDIFTLSEPALSILYLRLSLAIKN
jgi:hypothetical protein